MPAAKVTGCESRLLCFSNVLVTTYSLATAKIDSISSLTRVKPSLDGTSGRLLPSKLEQ
jgi:hypothetical protein